MRNRKFKKPFLSIAIVSSMLFTGSLNAFAAPLKDIQGHWAESAIQSWADQDLVSGYKDGTFKPNGNVTRSEFVVLINKSFGLTEEKATSFTDVKTTNWFYKDMSKAEAAGYLTEVAVGEFKPAQAVTRQEAASILAKLLELKPSRSADEVADVKNIEAEARGFIGAVVDAKLLQRNAKGNFRPNDEITRAEAVVVLARAIQYKKAQTEIIYNKPGVYGPATGSETVSKKVRITSPGVTLRNTTVEGDLIVEDTVGNGDVFLKGVSVKGTTTLNGGGANSVHFENSVIVKIIVNKKDGNIRIVVEGSTGIKEAVLQSGAALVESKSTGDGFQNVILEKSLPAGSKVTLIGNYDKVDVLGAKIRIEISQGLINYLNVNKSASEAIVNVSKEAKILELVLAAAAKVIGQGAIEKAILQASGATIEQSPVKVEVDKDVKAEVGGKPAVNTGSSGGGGGFGGGGGGGGIVTPNADKASLKSAIDTAQSKYNQAVEGLEIGEYLPDTKKEWLTAIQAAKQVHDSSLSTQQQVNQAVLNLNSKVDIVESRSNLFSYSEAFIRLVAESKALFASNHEGAGPGKPGSGTKAVFFNAIMAANAVKNNASATPQIKINAYYSLMSASEAFIDGFAIRNFDELQAVIDKSELALVNAIEGSAPGQYRAGAKADLDTSLNLSGSRKLLEEKPKGPQYTLDFNIFWALRALSKFEGERIAENQTVLSPQSGVYTTTSWTIQSTSVTGAVYAVPNSEFPLTLFDLQAAVTKGEARSVPMNGSVVVQLNVSGLKAGDYKLYHVDETGKLSRAFLNYAIIPSSASSVVVQSSRNHTGAISNKITWTDSVSSGVTYSILRGTSPGYGESTLLVESIAPGTNEFIDNDPDLKPGTTYYYRVAAMTRDNNGSFTNDIPVVTPSE